jgi:hypothetical protein
MTLYTKLVNAAPQVRPAGLQLAAVTTRQVADDVKRLIVANSTPDVAEAGLLFLHERDASEIEELLTTDGSDMMRQHVDGELR